MRVQSNPRAARPIRIAIALLSAIGLAGCGDSPRPEAELPPPTASEGLVLVRLAGAGVTDLFQARIADGSVRRMAETPLLEANPHWLPSVLRVLYSVRPADEPTASPTLMMRDPVSGDASAVSEKTYLSQADASVSVDGKRVAFVFEAPPGVVPGRGIRVVVPMTGRDEVLGVVPNAVGYASPRIAPDGGSVVVQVQRGDRGDDLWQLLTGRRVPLVNNPRWHDTAPRFTRDGGSVLFARSTYRRQMPRSRRSGEPLGGGDLCRVHIETKRTECIVRSSDAFEHMVEPSPTRDEIVFVRERPNGTDLFLAGLDGQGERQLTSSPDRAERLPVWSPDGERIAYVDGRAPQLRTVVIDREGKVVFETPGYQAAWAPPFRD